MKPLETLTEITEGDRLLDPSGKSWQVVDNTGGVVTICRFQKLSVVPDGWQVGDSYVEQWNEVKRLKARIAELEALTK